MPNSQSKYGPDRSGPWFNSEPKRTFSPAKPVDNSAQVIADARKKVGQCSQTEGDSDEYEPDDSQE